MFEYTENNIADLIAKNQRLICTSYDFLVPKCYTSHDNECDLLAVRKSGFCDEFEIKISRSDLLNDRKKKVAYRKSESRHDGNKEDWKHNDKLRELGYEKWKKLVAPWEKLKYEALACGDTPINHFWYVIKHDIADLCDIPDWAGLIKVFDNCSIRVIRAPSRLHKNKVDFEFKFNMVRKLGYRYWDERLKK